DLLRALLPLHRPSAGPPPPARQGRIGVRGSFLTRAGYGGGGEPIKKKATGRLKTSYGPRWLRFVCDRPEPVASSAYDTASLAAAGCIFRRAAKNARPAKPRAIIAQVDGSGTGEPCVPVPGVVPLLKARMLLNEPVADPENARIGLAK